MKMEENNQTGEKEEQNELKEKGDLKGRKKGKQKREKRSTHLPGLFNDRLSFNRVQFRNNIPSLFSPHLCPKKKVNSLK